MSTHPCVNSDDGLNGFLLLHALSTIIPEQHSVFVCVCVCVYFFLSPIYIEYISFLAVVFLTHRKYIRLKSSTICVPNGEILFASWTNALIE